MTSPLYISSRSTYLIILLMNRPSLMPSNLHTHEIAPHDAGKIGDNGQDGEHEKGSDDPGNDQILNRVQSP